MKYFLAVLAFLAASAGYSQEFIGSVDTLKSEMRSMRRDTNLVVALCNISSSYHAVDIDSSMHYAKKALALSEQLQYKNGLAWSYLLIGQTYSRRNEVEQAMSFYQSCVDLGESLNNRTVVCRALANIGWCMFDLEDYYRAIDYFKRALSYQDLLSGQDPYFITLKINIAQTYLANNRLAEAEEYLNKVLAYDRKEIPNYGYLLNMLSALRLEQKKYTTADSLLHSAWAMIEPLPDRIDKADNRYYVAKLSLIHGDLKSAFDNAKVSYDYYMQIGSKSDMERIDILLSQIESRRGRTREALNYILEANVLRDSVHSSRAKYSEYLFSSREQNRKTSLQEKDKELMQARQRNQRVLGVSLLSISVSVIAGLSFFVWQRQQTYKKLLVLNEKLFVLNDELVSKEAAIANQNALLRETNDSKDRLFSIIGHDLRSPINSLIGLMNLLSDHYDMLTPDELKKYLGDLNRSLKNLNNLTGNLLEWSLSQTNTIKFVFESFDITHALKEVEELFRELALLKKITIVNEAESGLLVWAHPHSVKTVMRNLISNAIKFTNEGGQVTLQAERINDVVRIAVTDNGVGIPEELLGRLFGVGDKHSTPGTANEKGSGLGLMLCREFAEKNGGSISVETKIGEGSVFYFTLPAARD